MKDYGEHVLVRWPDGAPPRSQVPDTGTEIRYKGYPYVVINPIPEPHFLGTRWAIRARPLNCEPDPPEWVYLDEIEWREHDD